MPYLIDQSFFIGDITIPNPNDRTEERINSFIRKYEPECLIKVLGYGLYKAFLAETNGIYQRTILGSSERADEQIQVGHTTGLVANTNTFTFNGTGGKPDYRGYNLVPTEIGGRGLLIRGVDYAWNNQTGKFDLLTDADVFALNRYYNIHFEPVGLIVNEVGNGNTVTSRMTDLLYGCEYTDIYGRLSFWKGIIYDTKYSLVAYYIYHYMIQSMATQTTGSGEVATASESGKFIFPFDKTLNSWNMFSRDVKELLLFLWNKNSVYPEVDNAQLARIQDDCSPINFLGI